MKIARMVGILLGCVIGLGACNGGPRPTLVPPPEPTPEPDLQLTLPAAPEAATPLPPAPADLALESSVDDALLAWAIDRSVPYVDSCVRVTPTEGQLCDVATERDTVRLLGPSSSEIWYVVTVLQVTSFDSGTGYRVDDVHIAGR